MKEKRAKDFQVASTQDLTGLIPAGPIKEDELMLYEELYPFYPPPDCIKAASEKDREID